MNLKRTIRIDSKRSQIEMDPPRLRMKAIEIDDDDDNVGEIVRCSAVTDQGWIICFVKAQIAIALQRQIFLADAVDPRNQVLEARAGMEIAVLQFILLGIQILFAPGLDGKVFTKLE